MSRIAEHIEADALKLPREARAKVALHLLDSLEQEQVEVSPAALERAWVAESLQRLEAYKQGKMQAYPLEAVIAELKKSLT